MVDERLEYFQIAQELNEEFKTELTQKQLHFRGNVGSFSLISLNQFTPEQGKGRLTTRKQGLSCKAKIDIILAEKKEKIERGKSRLTREKELQAWIINYALSNGHTLPFSSGLTFLTSELAYPVTEENKKSEKIVNDILAIDQEGSLAVIELKSLRNKKELENQVEKFCKVIAADPSFFMDLVKLLAPGKEWNGKVRKMIVWPAANRRSQNDLAEDIEEVRYKQKRGEDGRFKIDYDKYGNIVFS
jgi:hypothetical protein